MEIVNSLLLIGLNFLIFKFLLNRNFKMLGYTFLPASLFVILNLFFGDLPLKLIPITLIYSFGLLVLSFMSSMVVYIKLESGLILFLPFTSPDLTIKFQSHNSLAKSFNSADYLKADRRKIMEGYQIKDIHFFCTDTKPSRLDEDKEAGFMELSNGYFVTIEENWVKATALSEKPDLIVLEQNDFEKLSQRNNIKSLVQDILKKSEIQYDDEGIVI